MLIRRTHISLLLTALFFVNILKAQDNTLEYIQKLTISEGLAHNGVTSILEDSKGYLWISTFDGLNRYDGYEFETFKNTVDRKILINNRVRCINEDSKGNIWIGTDEGLSIYNNAQQVFTNLYPSNQKFHKSTILDIFFHQKQGLSICATEKNGLLIFNTNYNYIGQYLPDESLYAKKPIFFSGIALDDSYYLFTTSEGLFLFNGEDKSFQKVLSSDIAYSNDIVFLDEKSLLVSLNEGVAIIEYEADYKFRLLFKHFNDYTFKSIALDKLGQLWLGTLRDGIVRVDNVEDWKAGKKAEKSIFKLKNSILRISYMLPSQRRGCWVGTFDEGIFQFDLEANPFKNYDTEKDSPFGLYSNDILSIAPLDSHRIFLSANRGGLALFNTKTADFESLPFEISNRSRLNFSKIFMDEEKDIWLKMANNFGFGRVKNGSRIVEKITHPDPPDFVSIRPRIITADQKGDIWIGAIEGAYRMVLDTQRNIARIEALNQHPFFNDHPAINVRVVYADPMYNLVWLGSQAHGLFRMTLEKGKPLSELKLNQFTTNDQNPYSISSNFVSAILRLPNGDFWIGTERGGICKVSNSDKVPEFTVFSEKEGLSNNVVKSIVYDEQQNDLWISTNIGLNRFDLEEQEFRKFSKEDGLPFEDFEYASTQLKNGLIVLSGRDGLCYFKPNEIRNQERLPSLNWGNLKIFNEPILPNDTINGRVLLTQNLDETNEITLKHFENVFSIEVNALHFSNPENYRIKYQLLPINEEWIQRTSDQKQLNYSGLPPGEYTLKVMASNSLNDWTPPKTIKIEILPPFWKTTWAYVLYALGLLLIMGGIMLVVTRIQSLYHNLQIEKLEKENTSKLNTAKMRFFANIAHEIKTPVTLITAPIDMLLSHFRKNPNIQDKLRLIQRQSNKISQLVDQVHDFQKADAQLLKMNYNLFDFNAFLDELVTDYQITAQRSGKQLDLIMAEEDIYVSADKDKLEKIFNNLLSNAFKHTKAGHKIGVRCKRTAKNLVVEVKDTGSGIAEEDLPYIFDRFYQSKRNDPSIGGVGIGLAFTERLVNMHYGIISVESHLEEGSTFQVLLPIVKPKPAENQAEIEEEILKIEAAHKERLPFIKNGTSTLGKKIDSRYKDAKIFYAEDNEDMRVFVEEVLANNFQVTAFPNGRACLNAMDTAWPDLILSDILMPELTGLELCKQIKLDVKTSHIPIVLLTACVTVDDEIEGVKVGADAYIRKPFDTTHLLTTIESLLHNRQRLRERFRIDHQISIEKQDGSEEDQLFLDRLYQLMADNLDNQEIDMDHLAKSLYLNRTHFYQKVKALTDQTPYELLKEYRLKRAAELLVQEKRSVNEVFLMTGFKSRTHFSKLFKERYKTTPGRYSKQ